ncbi:hypothetical protein DL768_007484 [Monosporascus sp. mg162]|nr:hypothetical protein DL768_007484 [Monosporascus sp. mg162]
MRCSQNSIPSIGAVGLPADINIGLTPRSNQSMEAMQICCAPNPVNVVQNCTLWCELPPAFMEAIEGSEEQIPWQLSSCFRSSGVNVSDVVATGGHVAEESSAIPGAKSSTAGFAVLILLMLGFLAG